MSVKGRIAALCVAIVTFMCIFLAIPGNVIAASKVDELKNKYAELEKRQNTLKKEIDSAKKDVNKYNKLLDAIKEQMENTMEQISILESSIKELDRSIAKKEKEIAQKEKEISESYGLLKQRLRALYMIGDVSTLEILLSAVDYSDFLEKAEFIRQITKHDKALIENLEEELTEIREKKAEIEEERKELSSNKVKLNVKKAQYIEQSKENEAALKKIQNNKKALEEQEKRLEREMEELEKEIERILREEMSKNTQYVGGLFTWPVPGYYHISSPYGMRWGKLHGGVDIATGSNKENIHGKNIVAANSGTVISVIDKGSSSYGKYLIIDHGGGVATLYAHCSAIVVTKGQKVTKGQVIAKVGSTGNSTGPHLHFEVRIDGNRVDPMQYFNKTN